VFLQYLLGFRRLGWDAFFVDWLDPSMYEGPLERSPGTAYLRGVMEQSGLGASYTLLNRQTGRSIAGLPRDEIVARARGASFLLNVMGYLDDEEILACARRRVFLDIDPGFGQMWHELGLHEAFAGHDDHVTIGENIGRLGCSLPTCGLRWLTSRQPVVLELWPAQAEGSDRFTSVATWRGAYAPIEFRGERYGLRAHEFRKFAELPRLTSRQFELALDIHEAEVQDRALLSEHGWRVVEPGAVAGDPDRYRAYIADSRAEFTVAKGMYVKTGSGWVSDRSICYLASGKPVLAQDTGLDALYPVGEGLLAFRTLDEALAGVEALERDYEGHARAARRLAEAYFDSDKVLGRLVESLGSA
jgi:hypothetical protein